MKWGHTVALMNTVPARILVWAFAAPEMAIAAAAIDSPSVFRKLAVFMVSSLCCFALVSRIQNVLPDAR